MKSMTGFGEGVASSDGLEVAATLRSVNHRFLDVSVKLPEELRSLETVLVQQVKTELERGRVEVRLNLARRQPGNVRVTVDRSVADQYVAAARRLADVEGVESRLAVGELLRLPEVVSVESHSVAVSEEEAALVRQATAGALAGLVSARAEEGANLAAALETTLGRLSEIVDRLERAREGLQASLHENLRKRLEEVAGAPVIDEARVAQEVAVLVERADVQEELDRLRSHLDQFGNVLKADGGVGKRLDFLSQEVLRELNTIGSKCKDADAARLVVDGKVCCEQLREQVQNVE